jgi:flagellar assembly protein FliH
MRNYIRFIPEEEVGKVEQWNFDAVDTVSLLLAEQARQREEASVQAQDEAIKVQDEVIRQQGYAEGFVQGQAQAAVEAQRQIADFIANQGAQAARDFAQLFVSAQAQLADAEQVMAQGVLELACELARQVLRQELSVNPNVLQPVIREALGLLSADAKSALIRLHPVDLDVMQALIQAEFPGLSLSLVGDASITQGGCLIESAGTVVNGTLEKRWMRAVANLGLSSAWEVPADEP